MAYSKVSLAALELEIH